MVEILGAEDGKDSDRGGGKMQVDDEPDRGG